MCAQHCTIRWRNTWNRKFTPCAMVCAVSPASKKPELGSGHRKRNSMI